ncbi:penicillin-binding protein 2 [Paraburkholderia sp. SIMBA_055]|jgi:cell division protein FtsI (penicillin-binding protein 3)|uniref:Peptidoglycan D,D-transpeptidase FtsI n=1 Tax=Paraburkholderia graminis TaxID=60548 RepID=A0ABD5CKN5_9BURK|nr:MULTISPECIES: penicillin-binding protein 2 [Paraburkholderia]AXF10192.1 penicillin-binding protein 2 [Paraburkholderia graminis]MDQ0624629.1 cell division protein FtsI (penicillin-binding protein 3) [Paraburkholderia graminis]MDR6205787.1 cell division protein FtsI (penicillin-binding protein 3) [Paraburkholderia graminis]MDR6470650.1 cell division protein FtsI (penicillin-binding protein 3) [Paraburkholderia graminis]MDR6475285.1 cell division protein FtsI (penicillin-binding protein 3) [P
MIPKKKSPSRDSYAPVAKNQLLVARLPMWRSKFIVVLVFAAFAALAGRAFWVQVVNRDFYVDQGQKRYQRTIELDATRGRIVDRNGSMLAVSLATYEIWATPKLLDEAALPPLSKLLDLPLAELRRRLNGDKTFVLLKRQVDADTAGHLSKLGLAGITQIADSKRFYPEGESAAHVVGFTDIEDNGQEGVELAANEQLLGVPGHREVIRDRLGRVVSETRPLVPAQNGDTIHLTIDRRIQQLAYAQLKDAIAKHRAEAGSVVVLDARNGEILALANYPSFDPNDRARLTGRQLRNRAVVDTFEPGSTIKPVVVALSIDEGKVRPQSVIDTAPGWYKIGPAVIHDTSNHGAMTVAEAVQKSSNIALAKLALNLPAEKIWAKYQEYGLGMRPELTFPGVASGKVRPYKRWRPIEQATMAYGYGLSASLLQIAQIYTAYAGDGTMHPVRLVRENIDAAAAASQTGHAVTTPATARAIRSMLEMATGDGGTGRAATVEGYRIGGKTGTARKQVGASYAKNRYRALFVGMAPMSDPRLIVAVMIDDPAGKAFYGGTVAGPVFSAVTGGSLQLLGVPPDARGVDGQNAAHAFAPS